MIMKDALLRDRNNTGLNEKQNGVEGMNPTVRYQSCLELKSTIMGEFPVCRIIV